MSWEQVQPFLTALAIGLLLGFERERSHRRKLPAGSRTFALLSLMGVVAASLSEWLALAGLVGITTLMIVAYVRTSATDTGTTTEVAAVVAYLLGVLAWQHAALAVGLAVVVVALLVSKDRLHHFARDIVTEIELEDALKFFVVAFVVLPLLPNQDLGPYGVLNPAKVWLLVVLLTGIGWVGYIGVRALGPRRGLLVTGLAGGFVSASATTASMGRLSRSTGQLRPPLAGALVASLATFAQLMIVIGFVDPEVFAGLVPPVVAGTVVLTGVATVVYRGSAAPLDPDTAARGTDGSDDHDETREVAAATTDVPAAIAGIAAVAAAEAADPEPDPEPASAPERDRDAPRPFALKPALILAAVLTFALLVGRWGAEVLGPRGAVLAAAAAGLADAHAGAVAAASLAAKDDITVDTALVAVAAAMGSNLLVKAILAFTAGGRRFGLWFLAGMTGPAIAFATVLAATIRITG